MASEVKEYTIEDVKGHTREDDCWLVINGEVYDVTEFLDEHPGGFDIIISNTGKDATEEFEEIGHSKSAHELLQNYKIGTFKDIPKKGPRQVKGSAVKIQSSTAESSTLITLLKVMLPVIVLAAIFLPRLFKSE